MVKPVQILAKDDALLNSLVFSFKTELVQQLDHHERELRASECLLQYTRSFVRAARSITCDFINHLVVGETINKVRERIRVSQGGIA